jgi:hypothetical protein
MQSPDHLPEPDAWRTDRALCILIELIDLERELLDVLMARGQTTHQRGAANLISTTSALLDEYYVGSSLGIRSTPALTNVVVGWPAKRDGSHSR